jgi:hypothetical protein
LGALPLRILVLFHNLIESPLHEPLQPCIALFLIVALGLHYVIASLERPVAELIFLVDKQPVDSFDEVKQGPCTQKEDEGHETNVL